MKARVTTRKNPFVLVKAVTMVVLLSAGLLLWAPEAQAQVTHTLQAFAFVPFDQTSNVTGANILGSRFCTAPCFLDAPLLLPSGASVSEVEVEACDTDPINDLSAVLVVVGNLEASATEVVTAGTAGTPGCNFFSGFLAAPITIDNLANSYFVEVAIGGTTEATRFQTVRIFYSLPVGP